LLRIFGYIFILFFLFIILGCGGEDKIIDTQEPCWGLCDNTYRSQKFAFNITELPIDKWTVKTYGENGQGKVLSSEFGVKTYIMLLMQPNAEGKFIDLDEGKYIDSILDAGMPFITVWVYEYQNMDIPTHEFLDIMRMIYADANLYEAKPIAGSNNTGYQVMGQYDDDNTITLSWFIKKNILVEIGYVAENKKHTSYLGTYNHVVSHLTIMGQ